MHAVSQGTSVTTDVWLKQSAALWKVEGFLSGSIIVKK